MKQDILTNQQKQFRAEMRKLRLWGKCTEDEWEWIQDYNGRTREEIDETFIDLFQEPGATCN